MALETGTFVDDLVSTNPPGTDAKSQGDDHLRLIKTVLKGTFPNSTRAFRFPEAAAAKTTGYSVLIADANSLIRGDATSGALTVTLPLLSAVFAGFIVTIMKSDSGANVVTVDGNGAETINGATTRALAKQFEVETYESEGTEWKVISSVTEDREDSVIASATTTEIWGTGGRTRHVSGTTNITSFGTAPRAGASRWLIFDGALLLSNSANLALQGGLDITTAAGDFAYVYADSTSQFDVLFFPKSGTAVLNAYDIAFNAGFDVLSVKEDVAVQTYTELVMCRSGSFITGEEAYADTAPTGAAMILDVLKNGTTIYATKPQFAIAAQTLTDGVLKTDGTEDFVTADRITFKVTQIGSTAAGQGVRFTIRGELA